MSEYRVIDVSMWMDAFDFPGNPPVTVCGPFNRVAGENREFVYDIELCTQSGTHIQGAHYFREDGSRINDHPLESFEGIAYILDIHKRGTDVTLEEIKRLLKEIDLKDKILILRTGHMEELIRTGKIDHRSRPGISLDAARYLCEEKGIRMIGIDSIGLESRVTENYEVNVYLCSQGIIILEGLVNLHSIRKNKVFLEAYPLKIRGVEGTPCRAIVKEYME
ncbi:MAG TPA: cyclase family protein [Synergistales bacterium]|nr:cyclase family protein [Synergistales bacterium]